MRTLLVVALVALGSIGCNPAHGESTGTATATEQAVRLSSDSSATPQQPEPTTTIGAPRADDLTGAGWQTVTHVVDGDTIRFENGVTVRMIGVDAPEVGHDYNGWIAEPCATEALDQMLAMTARRVFVDVGEGTPTDARGRTLGYVFAEDGTFINVAMLSAGLATVDRYPEQHNTRWDPVMDEAEVVGRTGGGCVWR